MAMMGAGVGSDPLPCRAGSNVTVPWLSVWISGSCSGAPPWGGAVGLSTVSAEIRSGSAVGSTTSMPRSAMM